MIRYPSMKKAIRPFEYFSPKTLGEATSLLKRYGSDAKILAGGTDLLVWMKDRILTPRVIISIRKIVDISSGIETTEEGLVIGALTKISDLESSAIVRESYLGLQEAAFSLGSAQVRNMATVGGNICRASPSGDVLNSLNSFKAIVTLVGAYGTREVPVQDFCVGPGKTVMIVGEIATKIKVPKMPENSASVFLKLSRTAVDLAKINLSTTAVFSKNGLCEDICLVAGAVAPIPKRLTEAEEILKGTKFDEKTVAKAAEAAAGEVKPITDIRSTERYRRKMVTLLMKRAAQKLLERKSK